MEWWLNHIGQMAQSGQDYSKKHNVTVSRFTDNPGKQLFAQKKMTRFQLGKIFEMRCWEKGRPDIMEILKNIGLSEYNPYEIVKHTHGVSYNDFIWFRFPGEKLTSKDVLVRKKIRRNIYKKKG